MLICATIILNLVMIRDGLNGMTDMKWHLTWLQHFYKELTEGIWYPRWLSGTNYGYGSPTFVFYPPLVYYLGSLFKFIGLSTENTVTLLFSLALFLSGFNFYLFACNRWSKISGFFGSIAYMSMPYLALDIYWRGGLSSIFTQAWIPLIWWLTDKCFSQPKQIKWMVLLAFSWTIAALTHVPSLLICCIAWSIYILYYLLNKPWKTVVKVIASPILGFGVASLYLLPAIFEQSFVNVSVMKGVLGGFKAGMLGVGLSLIDININQLVSIPYIFAHQSLGIFCLSIVIIIAYKQDKKIFHECLLWTFSSLFIVFMMTPLSIPIWNSSSTLQMLQFPWRFLQIYAFFGAAIFSFGTHILIKSRLKLKIILFLILALLLIFNGRYYYKLSRQYITLDRPGRGNIEHLAYINTILNDPYNDNLRDVEEYRTLTNNQSPPQPLINQEKLSVIEGKAELNLENWLSYQRKFTVTAKTFSVIKIRTYYYPAWHLYVNNNFHQVHKYQDGTIAFNLEPGFYNVLLVYKSTKSFVVGIIISITSLIILLILFNFKFSENIIYLKFSKNRKIENSKKQLF